MVLVVTPFYNWEETFEDGAKNDRVSNPRIQLISKTCPNLDFKPEGHLQICKQMFVKEKQILFR
jgi:hypothetical protein